MLKRERKPTQPGKMLQEMYLKPREVSITDFANAIGCSRKHISNIIHSRARIEANLATRIAAVLDTTPQLWLNLQNTVDVYEAMQENKGWKPARTFFAEA